MRRRVAVGAALAAFTLVGSSCSGSSDDIVGNWRASDGSVKSIAESGECSGMYYNQGQPLDIGGPMTCSFSEEVGDDGRHALVVVQGPNQETLSVEFRDSDTVVLYDGSGVRLVELVRM